MMVIRPVESGDLAALFTMASNAGVGVTTLPANESILEKKINDSLQSFKQKSPPDAGRYLFVLEDTEIETVVGVCGLIAHVGLDEAWYNYRVSTTVLHSKELNVYQKIPTLYLTNDLTGCTEVCTLFLHPDYRHSQNGRLLSKCRFMFLADFADLFSSKVFAEMRGVSNAQGISPFWNALGKKFFSLEFSQADYLSGLGNKSFIAELMPHYPIYLPLLSQDAQEVVGSVHDNTIPARRMLESEGFNYNGFIDIFDAGPVIEAFVHNVGVVRDSFKSHALVVKRKLEQVRTEMERGKTLYMVSNRAFAQFRVTLVPESLIHDDGVDIPEEIAQRLNIRSGDVVRVSRLREQKGDNHVR